MSTAAKQQKLQPNGIPDTASTTANRQLVEDAVNAHRLSGPERQVLFNAWDHDKNWKAEHTLWFRDSEEVRAVLRKYGLMPEERK